MKPHHMQLLLWCVNITLGAALSWPVWKGAHETWLAHRDREAQREVLSQRVHDLDQQRKRQEARHGPRAATPRPHETPWRDLSPQDVLAALQSLLQAQDLSWRALDMGQPLWVRGAWLCPFEIRASGAVVPWLQVWQHIAKQHPGSVWMASRLLASWPDEDNIRLQWHLPCRIEPAEASERLSDPFSLSAWQALHAQRAGADASFAKLSARWHQPRTPLEQFTLDQVHYVGRLQDAHKTLAVIQVRGDASEVHTHSVARADALGAHWGTVTRVDAEAIEVQEWLRDEAGVWRSRVVRLPWEGAGP